LLLSVATRFVILFLATAFHRDRRQRNGDV